MTNKFTILKLNDDVGDHALWYLFTSKTIAFSCFLEFIPRSFYSILSLTEVQCNKRVKKVKAPKSLITAHNCLTGLLFSISGVYCFACQL